MSNFSSPASTPNRSLFTKTPTKTPLKTPSRTPGRINNDEAERLQRRQSNIRNRQQLLSTPQQQQRAVIGTVDSPFRGLKTMTDEELNRQYEEWMKIAADGKINATNTWNLNLIDYFYNLTVLKEGESINFQKASCTLDGCVKIYTSRVDSVAAETGRLLSGLSETQGKKVREEEEEDGEEEEGKQKAARKRATRTENTLVKDVATINLKKFDLEFAVDPLFRKTSADFDEGGARGLLLNHLSTHGDLKIIFDSSDVTGEEEDDTVEVVEDMWIDMEKLSTFTVKMAEMDEYDICAPFKHFTFDSNDADADLAMLKRMLEVPETDDHPQMDDDVADMFAQNDDDLGHYLPPNAAHYHDDDEDGDDMGQEHTGHVTAILSPNDYVLSMSKNNNPFFSYFDHALTANWAGPQHWKLSHTVKPPPPTKKDTVKKKKEPFSIDFVDVDKEPQERVLFARAKTTIDLPKNQAASTHVDKYLLPQDYRYSAKDFFSLFMKPSVMISGRTKRHVIANKSVQDEALLDEQGDFWNDAQSMADDHSLDPADIPLPPSDAEEDDDGGHNILEAVEAEDIEYGNQLISQGGRRVKPIFMNYAKVAKRVDVRKLKENIWTNLENDEPEQRFTEVMDGLHAVYPEQKMNDISVSFCFICLLHLANEKNLEISSTSTLDELVVKRHV